MPHARCFRALATIIALGSACGGEKEPTGPVAGDLTVAYGTQSANDGAVLMLITGGPVTSVTGAGPYQLASASVGVNATRVVVTGNLAAGDLFRIRVPDVSLAGNYTARLEAVADRNTFALSDPGLYTTSVR
jgi:hypothetical protein